MTRKVVYKITYPNGKIYIGQDRTDSPNYFGSAKSDLFRSDFSQEELDDLTARKQVIWASGDATNEELSQREKALILDHGSNNPKVGYNKWPKWSDK